MPKPSVTADWDTNGTSILATTAGHKSDGFILNEVPTFNEFNYWMQKVGLWIAYLNAGAMDGAFTFNSTVAVTGAATLTGGVAGNTSCTGKWTATDFHYTADQTLKVNSVLSQNPAGGHTRFTLADGWSLGASVNKVIYPITGLRMGDVITGWTLYINKTTTGASTITADLYSTSGLTGSAGSLSTSSNSANAPGYVQLGLGTAITVAASKEYYVVVTPPAAGGDELHHLEVTVTRP